MPGFAGSLENHASREAELGSPPEVGESGLNDIRVLQELCVAESETQHITPAMQ